jgi:hypothetical protein
MGLRGGIQECMARRTLAGGCRRQAGRQGGRHARMQGGMQGGGEAGRALISPCRGVCCAAPLLRLFRRPVPGACCAAPAGCCAGGLPALPLLLPAAAPLPAPVAAADGSSGVAGGLCCIPGGAGRHRAVRFRAADVAAARHEAQLMVAGRCLRLPRPASLQGACALCGLSRMQHSWRSAWRRRGQRVACRRSLFRFCCRCPCPCR